MHDLKVRFVKIFHVYPTLNFDGGMYLCLQSVMLAIRVHVLTVLCAQPCQTPATPMLVSALDASLVTTVNYVRITGF